MSISFLDDSQQDMIIVIWFFTIIFHLFKHHFSRMRVKMWKWLYVVYQKAEAMQTFSHAPGKQNKN